jgi:Domain of unknown function (DUF1902)
MHKHITVQALYDPEAQVWVATSEDVIGLVAEAPSLPELTDIVAELIPELLALNHHSCSDHPLPFVVHSMHETRLH